MSEADQPAFPSSKTIADDQDRKLTYNDGLSKREYFAASALRGLLSNPSVNKLTSNAVVEAVSIADALIEQLAKRIK
jgi:hypothetical protein